MGDPEPQGFRSWAEMVEGYRVRRRPPPVSAGRARAMLTPAPPQRTKLQDPWRDGGFRPQSRVTHFEKSRESRVFNPVLQRFNDEQLVRRCRGRGAGAAWD